MRERGSFRLLSILIATLRGVQLIYSSFTSTIILKSISIIGLAYPPRVLSTLLVGFLPSVIDRGIERVRRGYSAIRIVFIIPAQLIYFRFYRNQTRGQYSLPIFPISISIIVKSELGSSRNNQALIYYISYPNSFSKFRATIILEFVIRYQYKILEPNAFIYYRIAIRITAAAIVNVFPRSRYSRERPYFRNSTIIYLIEL